MSTNPSGHRDGHHVDPPPSRLTRFYTNSNCAPVQRPRIAPLWSNSEDAPGHGSSGQPPRSLRTLHQRLSSDLGPAGRGRARLSRLPGVASRPLHAEPADDAARPQPAGRQQGAGRDRHRAPHRDRDPGRSRAPQEHHRPARRRGARLAGAPQRPRGARDDDGDSLRRAGGGGRQGAHDRDRQGRSRPAQADRGGHPAHGSHHHDPRDDAQGAADTCRQGRRSRQPRPSLPGSTRPRSRPAASARRPSPSASPR